MSLIRRFPLRTKLYDKILMQPWTLENLDYFLRPLFSQEPEKGYNLNKAFQLQRPIRRKEETDTSETLDFDEDTWLEEQSRRHALKLNRYRASLSFLIEAARAKGEITLAELEQQAESDKGKKETLIPDVEVFKEIMVELIKSKVIDIDALQKERSEYIQDKPGEFQLSEMLLELAEAGGQETRMHRVEVYRLPMLEPVTFTDIMNESGERKSIRCSNVLIRVL